VLTRYLLASTYTGARTIVFNLSEVIDLLPLASKLLYQAVMLAKCRVCSVLPCATFVYTINTTMLYLASQLPSPEGRESPAYHYETAL